MMKNNPLRYFVIEFFVILFSILGAFTLDEWSNQREKEKMVEEIIWEIYDDAESMKSDLKADADFLRLGVISNARIRDHFDKDLRFDSTLCFDFYFATDDEFTFPSRTGYDRLLNINAETEVPDSLLGDLSDLYQDLFPRIMKETSFIPDLNEYFGAYMEENFLINEDSTLKHSLELDETSIDFPIIMPIQEYRVVRTIGYFPIDFDQLKNDHKFRNMLVKAFEYKLFKYNRYRLMIEEIDEIKATIEAIYGLRE